MTACGPPDLPRTDPTTVVTAAFDPTTSQIPLPNDLVFLQPVNGVCGSGVDGSSTKPACAQAELLASFSHGAPANAPALTGDYPSDQEVAVTIDFTQTSFAGGKATTAAPDLDLTSFTPSTFLVYGTTPTTQGAVPLDPATDLTYVKAADNSHGTLTIHNTGHLPWPTGSYAVVIRGGASGVKTKDGIFVSPSQVFDLIAQDVDMTDPKNLGLLKAQFGSTAEALKQGMQLNAVRLFYDASAFPIADLRFPHHELAIATTFKIAPLVTNVSIDPGRGLAPLPIDLLRDPATGKLSALAACTLAGSSLAADGSCATAAATAASAGFRALDGFSTTGAILGPTSDLVRVSSVTKDSLQLWDLSDKTNPVQVDPTTLILEPCEFTSACGSPTALSPVIALQPAGATAGDSTSVFRTKPLKDSTDYAVVMTTGILDKAGNPLGSGTVASVLKFTNPVSVGGRSALVGIDDTTASSVEKMRTQLAPLFAKLTAAGTDRSKVALAYTFHTQTILSQAVGLAALPYDPRLPAATALPGPVTAETPAAAFTKFGVNAGIPSSNIDEILEADITTFNLLDPATGAFNPDPTKAAPEPIHVLIATPKVTSAPLCPSSTTLHCAPMMIFRHGLGRGRADMLLIADTYAAAGMATVAIDAAKHGDRSLCSSGAGAASGCVGTCTPIPGSATQGDPSLPGPPGTCDAAGFVKDPVTPGASHTDGIPKISGNYLISANFFRTRDTLRQDLIDESQLVRALAVNPADPQAPNNGVFTHLVGKGLIIDPATIYYSGQSLGAIQGTMNVATNPRISKAVLNVGGGTIADIFTNSPAFAPAVDQLLAGLGIQRGTAQFLQFLVVAKTILDPADPVNFAGHLTANTLPNLLPPLGGAQDGHIPQAPKKILTQMANCDGVVPNPFGFVWASNIPTGPLPSSAAFFTPAATGTFELFVTTPFDPTKFGTCPGTSAVNHGFLLDFANPQLTLNAQTDAANFVMNDTSPLRVQHQ